MTEFRTKKNPKGGKSTVYALHNNYDWKPEIPSEEHIRRELKNVSHGRRIAFTVVDGLPTQTNADLKFEAAHGNRVFWAPFKDFISIQSFVNGKHVDEVKEDIGSYQVPNVRVYHGKLLIQDGNHRMQAMRELGFTEFPVRIAGHDPSPKARTRKDKLGHYIGDMLKKIKEDAKERS